MSVIDLLAVVGIASWLWQVAYRLAAQLAELGRTEVLLRLSTIGSAGWLMYRVIAAYLPS
ncbi:MAG: hypothetical protein K2V38_16770 [Gemmataceae bacterium]|nr:hypothetical protein [Gemmataceae bacterium]